MSSLGDFESLQQNGRLESALTIASPDFSINCYEDPALTFFILNVRYLVL